MKGINSNTEVPYIMPMGKLWLTLFLV